MARQVRHAPSIRQQEVNFMATRPKIVVVGAGIIGASIAWHLAKAGAAVTVVEAGEPGGIATPASFAWINAGAGNPRAYFDLRIRSMAEWRRLADAVPGLRPNWCGGLCWDLDRDALEAFAVEHGGWGYGIHRVVRAEAALLEPNIAEPPDRALHVVEEGAVEPRAAALALLADAKRLGARLVAGSSVTALAQEHGRTIGVVTADGRLDADEVVLAAGAATSALAFSAGIDLPLVAPPGLLVHSHPHAKLLNGLVLMPNLHLRQTGDGRIVMGADFGGADPGDDPLGVAHDLFAKGRAALLGADQLRFNHFTIGYRPTPADRLPVVGRTGGPGSPYLAVMHSGITLAPAVGRFAAEELLTGRRDPLLLSYAPARFTEVPGVAAAAVRA